MFTGIVQGIGKVVGVVRKDGLMSLSVELPDAACADLERGASIAIDGVCLTVSDFKSKVVTFDLMGETLARTTLGSLITGNLVDVERAAKANTEIGGHILSGHVDTQAKIAAIDKGEGNYVITFTAEKEWLKYIFAKGYIAINGASLTIASVNKEECKFTVWLIPETLRLATLNSKKVGDCVNIEIERTTQIVVDTVNAFMAQQKFAQ